MRRARPSGMRVIGLVLAVIFGAVGFVVSASAPAAACYCMTAGVQGSLDAADVVVTGLLIEKEDPPQRRLMSSTDPITYTVDVESTYKGEPLDEAVFTSAMSGASCGLEGLVVDERYTFFLQRTGPRNSSLARGEPGDLVGFLCGGTRPARDAIERRLVALTGPPVSVAVEPPAPVSPMPVVRDDSRAAWVLPATGAVLTGLGAAAVLVWRRRTRS